MFKTFLVSEGHQFVDWQGPGNGGADEEDTLPSRRPAAELHGDRCDAQMAGGTFRRDWLPEIEMDEAVRRLWMASERIRF
jgi:hypothetical protein